MSKISYKYKKGKILLSNKLNYPENLNEQIYLRLSNGMIPGFLTVNAVTKGKTTVLEGSLEGYINLKEYLGDTISKNTFLAIVSSLISTVKYCEDNMMTPNNIDLDLQRIFIKPQTSEILAVYWPVVNNQLAAPINKFFHEIVDHVKLPENEDRSFINTYSAFFSGITPFSLKNFEKMISEFKYGSSDRNANAVAANGTASLEKEPSIDRSVIEYDPFEGIKNNRKNSFEDISVFASAAMSVGSPENTVMCLTCGFVNNINSKYCRSCGAELVAPQAQPSSSSYPCIKRLSTGEIKTIDSSYFTVGTDASCSCCVKGNEHISHKHAALIYENGSFFLTDLGSTNGTQINSVPVARGQKVRIDIGTVFLIADEYFELSVVSS